MKKITAYMGLGLINILSSIITLALFFSFNPLPWQQNLWDKIQFWMQEPITFIIFTLLPIISFVITTYFAYMLYHNPKKISNRMRNITMFFPFLIFWTILFFLGYLFAASILFPLCMIVFILVCFSCLRKVSSFWATVITIITIIVTITAIMSGFEEDYCLKKADSLYSAADSKTTTYLTPTADEKAQGFTSVSPHYRSHMNCHKTFIFFNAAKETYLFQK